MHTKGKPPRLRLLWWLREIFLMTQPPLLAVMQGGDYRFIAKFIHAFIDRRYSKLALPKRFRQFPARAGQIGPPLLPDFARRQGIHFEKWKVCG